MEKLILIGGGGHCKSCIDTIECENKYEIAGILDIKENIGKKVLNYEIIGTDDEIENLVQKGYFFLITMGQIKSANLRISIFNEIKKIDGKLLSVISPVAYVSKHATVNEGTIILSHAFINADAKIGKNCIINSNAIIEHDCIIKDNCHISTGCVINGSCHIGENVFLGSRSVVNNNVSICDNVVTGSGSVIIKNITESGMYVGNPVRKMD